LKYDEGDAVLDQRPHEVKGNYAALSDPAQRQQYHIENRVSSDPHRNQSKDCTKGWRR